MSLELVSVCRPRTEPIGPSRPNRMFAAADFYATVDIYVLSTKVVNLATKTHRGSSLLHASHHVQDVIM